MYHLSKSITGQGKMTVELAIHTTVITIKVELADIYVSHKPKCDNNAEIAMARGVGSLAKFYSQIVLKC